MCVVGRQNGAQGSQIRENPTFGAEEVCASHGRERFYGGAVANEGNIRWWQGGRQKRAEAYETKGTGQVFCRRWQIWRGQSYMIHIWISMSCLLITMIHTLRASLMPALLHGVACK